MTRSRSPNYPIVGLDDAITGVQKVYKADYRNKVDKAVVAKHLGYGGINGKSLSVISTLSKFGLIEGRGDLRVTDDAVTIIVDAKSSVTRQQAIRRAALRPALFAQLNTHFGGTMPSAENLSAYLQKNGFTPQAAHAAGKSFRDTMQFVTHEAGNTAPVDGADGETAVFKVGDYVQWESQGAWQFDLAKKVVGVSDDATYAFVEGEATGIPMDQLIKADAPAMPRVPPVNPQHGAGGTTATAGKATEGAFSLSVPFAKGTISVQVRVTGDAMRPSHLARVRKYLELAESDWAADGDEMGIPRAESD